MPCVYDRLEDKNYEAVIEAYVAEGQDPRELDDFRQAVQEALEAPQVLARLSPTDLSLMEALKGSAECCLIFLHEILRNCQLAEIKTQKYNAEFWYNLLCAHFRRFAHAEDHAVHDKTHKEQTQEILQQIVVQGHLMSSELQQYHFDVEDFIADTFEILETFLEPVLSVIFYEKLNKILTQCDQHKAQDEFYLFLEEYAKCVSWRDPACKYICAFLKRVEFAWVKNSTVELYSDPGYSHASFAELAAAVHKTMDAETARQTLGSILQESYDTLEDKRYNAVI